MKRISPVANAIWPESLTQSLAGDFDAQVGLRDWWQAIQPQLLDCESSVDAALCGGTLAPTLGHAFVGGYRCALERLAPGLVAKNDVVSFCVSESGGAHPKAILATLQPQASSGYLLNGQKTWSTLAPSATTLLVAASNGELAGRKQLKMARVAAQAAGVIIAPRPPAPFLPNVPHAVVTFNNVFVAEAAILPGDGYADFIKPFRSLEDLHVTAAALGYIARWARQATWPADLIEQILLLGAAAIGLDRFDVRGPAMHLALADFLERFQLLLNAAQAEIDQAPAETLAEWRRDAAVFLVAAKARGLRREKARQILASPPA